MNDSQGHLKTPTPYSDKSDIPFGLMEDVIPTAIAMTPTGLKAIPAPGKTTGVFERVYRSWNIINDFPSNPLAVCARELANAYELDIAAKDKRIAELSKELEGTRTISGFKGVLNQHDDRIKELESQMSKVVVPTEHDRKRGTAYCACEAMIAEWDKYCNECGAQLNWEGLK